MDVIFSAVFGCGIVSMAARDPIFMIGDPLENPGGPLGGAVFGCGIVSLAARDLIFMIFDPLEKPGGALGSHHPPSQQYCKGAALASQDAQRHPLPNNIAWIEPLPLGCTAPPPPPNNIAKSRALASRIHSAPPPSKQYCKGGALAFQDAQHPLPL
ncbi:hypothetical protein LSTR_LSTR006642 [Laodelphax striatellus]|uniref:Uncharacterized protein n=1 Tax=Laodelphax striatellus TaxID=195883 RepID=A0A482X8Q6_LAOST|nr:hypothetical protein LSTR_LSTR006642 [Laodelphax striatellus]